MPIGTPELSLSSLKRKENTSFPHNIAASGPHHPKVNAPPFDRNADSFSKVDHTTDHETSSRLGENSISEFSTAAHLPTNPGSVPDILTSAPMKDGYLNDQLSQPGSSSDNMVSNSLPTDFETSESVEIPRGRGITPHHHYIDSWSAVEQRDDPELEDILEPQLDSSLTFDDPSLTDAEEYASRAAAASSTPSPSATNSSRNLSAPPPSTFSPARRNSSIRRSGTPLRPKALSTSSPHRPNFLSSITTTAPSTPSQNQTFVTPPSTVSRSAASPSTSSRNASLAKSSLFPSFGSALTISSPTSAGKNLGNIILGGNSTDEVSRSRSGSFTSSANGGQALSPAMSFLSGFSSPATSVILPDSVGEVIPTSPDLFGAAYSGRTLVVGKLLGRGAFSVVREAIDRETGQRRGAVKIILVDKSVSSGAAIEQRRRVELEIDIWKSVSGNGSGCLLEEDEENDPDSPSCDANEERGRKMDGLPPGPSHHLLPQLSRPHTPTITTSSHPNILPLLDYQFTPTATYLLMPYMPGASVFQHVTRSGRGKGLKEMEARSIFKDVTEGLDELHRLGIVHCDIKAENILGDGKGTWKIGDFGLSQLTTPSTSPLAQQQTVYVPAGSLPYAAPELLQYENTHDVDTNSSAFHQPAVDIWSLGVLLHFILTSRLPFADTFETRLRSKILKGVWTEPVEVGEAAMEVLRGCLELDLSKRLDITLVKFSDFVQGFGEPRGRANRVSSRSRSRSRSKSRRGSSRERK